MRKLSYWCAAGGSRDRFTALQNGLIDATVLTGAFVDRAKAAGMPVLLDLGDLEDSFATVSLTDVQDLAKHQAQCCARFSPGDQRGDLYFQKRSRARTKEPVEVDAHARQRLCSKALTGVTRRGFRFRPIPNCPASKSLSTTWRTARAERKRKKGAGVRQ